MAARPPDSRPVTRWTGARARALLSLWLAAAFALSATTDPRLLGAAALVAALLLRRGLARNLRRLARAVLPLTALLAACSWLLLWAVERRPPAAGPFAVLALRAGLIALVTSGVLDRVDLLQACAPWPAAARLLVITLSQVHALRLLVTDSAQGLRSRLLRRPGAREVVRGAGGAAASLLTLSVRHAREVTDALRAREL